MLPWEARFCMLQHKEIPWNRIEEATNPTRISPSKFPKPSTHLLQQNRLGDWYKKQIPKVASDRQENCKKHSRRNFAMPIDYSRFDDIEDDLDGGTVMIGFDFQNQAEATEATAFFTFQAWISIALCVRLAAKKVHNDDIELESRERSRLAFVLRSIYTSSSIDIPIIMIIIRKNHLMNCFICAHSQMTGDKC